MQKIFYLQTFYCKFYTFDQEYSDRWRHKVMPTKFWADENLVGEDHNLAEFSGRFKGAVTGYGAKSSTIFGAFATTLKISGLGKT